MFAIMRLLSLNFHKFLKLNNMGEEAKRRQLLIVMVVVLIFNDMDNKEIAD
jgi:hypothetical protein